MQEACFRTILGSGLFFLKFRLPLLIPLLLNAFGFMMTACRFLFLDAFYRLDSDGLKSLNAFFRKGSNGFSSSLAVFGKMAGNGLFLLAFRLCGTCADSLKVLWPVDLSGRRLIDL